MPIFFAALVLAVVRGRALDELEHADVVAAAPGAEQHAQRRGRLALAVAGVDDDERLLRYPFGVLRVRRSSVSHRRLRQCIDASRTRRPASRARRSAGPSPGAAATRTATPYTRSSDRAAVSTVAGAPVRDDAPRATSARCGRRTSRPASGRGRPRRGDVAARGTAPARARNVSTWCWMSRCDVGSSSSSSSRLLCERAGDDRRAGARRRTARRRGRSRRSQQSGALHRRAHDAPHRGRSPTAAGAGAVCGPSARARTRVKRSGRAAACGTTAIASRERLPAHLAQIARRRRRSRRRRTPARR